MSTASGVAPPSDGGADDYAGPIVWEYSPDLDGEPDPGEIVWAWVAFEEDSSIGKDRPLAVLGRTEDHRLVALMLSTRDHSGDRDWLAIGSGPWDQERRASWVRRDRVLAVEARAVRREGALLTRDAYETILRSVHRPKPGWQSLWRRLFGRTVGRRRSS